MDKIEKNLRLGIILDTRGDPPYVSVNRLWLQTLNVLRSRYRVVVYEVSNYDVESNLAYQEFINQIDILFLMSPYYRIDRSIKKLPVIVYGLGSLQKGGHWLYQNLNSFRRYDTLILNSSSCMAIYMKIGACSGIRPVLVPFGIDTEVFCPLEGSNPPSTFNSSDKPFTMIYVGRLNIQKNVHTLLAVLHELNKRYYARLNILGFFDDFYIPEFCSEPPPDSRSEFDRICRELKVSKFIQWIDHVDKASEIASYIRAANVGINLSTLISENFGLAIVEMQACGLPVISSDWGGMKDTVIHSETGYKIKTTASNLGARVDFTSAVRYLEYLIEHPQKLDVMSIKARDHSVKSYSLEVFAKKLYDAVDLTWDEFHKTGEAILDSHIEYDTRIKDLAESIIKSFPEKRHISWEHLHPKLDKNLYLEILTCCVSDENSIDSTVILDSEFVKAFPWYIVNGQCVSLDPRWTFSYELKDTILTTQELKVMGCIDAGHTNAKEIAALLGDELLALKSLISLSQNGFILKKETKQF